MMIQTTSSDSESGVTSWEFSELMATFCGNANLTLIDNSTSAHFFPGRCATSIFVDLPLYLLLLIFSAYSYGATRKPLGFSADRPDRSHGQVRLRLRIAFVFFQSFLSAITFVIAGMDRDDAAYWVSFVYVVGSQVVYLAYLNKLQLYVTELGHRGSKPLIVVYLLTFISVVIHLETSLVVFIHKITQSTQHGRPLHLEDFDVFDFDFIFWSVSIILYVAYMLTLTRLCAAPGLSESPIHNLLTDSTYSNVPTRRARGTRRGSHGTQIAPDETSMDSHLYGGLVSDEDSPLASKLVLAWVDPLMRSGAQVHIQANDDLFHLPHSLNAQVVHDRFNQIVFSAFPAADENDTTQRKVRLARGLFVQYWKPYVLISILKFFADGIGFAGPLLLNSLLSYLETPETADPTAKKSHIGFYYAIGLATSSLAVALSVGLFNFYIGKVTLQMRSTLIASIYRKLLALKYDTLTGRHSSGELLNFITTDVDRITGLVPSLQQFLSLPIQFLVTLFLLHGQLGVAYLTGVAFSILVIPLNRWIANKIASLSEKMMAAKDSRIKLMSEVLLGMGTIKMHAWEDLFERRINQIRSEELKHLRGRKYLDAFCVYFWATTPVVISSLAFTTFVLTGGSLTAARVFTSLALFGMLLMPLNAFPWVLNGLMEARVSLRRVQAFFDLPDLHLYGTHYNAQIDPPTGGHHDRKYNEIELNGATFVRSSMTTTTVDSESVNHNDLSRTSSRFVLGPLNIHLPHGQLIGVMGRVGSGKSSLIASLAGEMERLTGQLALLRTVRREGVALVTQEAWLRNASIRDNILFGRYLNEQRYEAVLEACTLHEDLKQLPRGDATMVGDRGVTLSGGQRARVALARALYQDMEVYLLDDPFSAVDAHVANAIYDKCIRGLLKKKTVLLLTNQSKFLKDARTVHVLDDGLQTGSGTLEAVLRMNTSLYPEAYLSGRRSAKETPRTQSSDEQHSKKTPNRRVSFSGSVASAGSSARSCSGSLSVAEHILQNKSISPHIEQQLDPHEDEDRKTGSVGGRVYRFYTSSMGGWLVSAILLSLASMQVSRTASDVWLAHWTSSISSDPSGGGGNHTNNSQVAFHLSSDPPSPFPPPDNSVKFYLTVFVSIGISNSFLTLIRAFVYAYGGIVAARRVHRTLLTKILRARVAFFEATPFGQVINRFSSDLYNVDDALPFILNIFLANVFGLTATIVVTTVGLPWILILIGLLAFPYYQIQRFYRWTSRELRRLSAISLAPLYAQTSETFHGLVTIRAFKATQRFLVDFYAKLDASTRALYASRAASEWLNMRLQFLGVAVTGGVSLLAVILHYYEWERLNVGLMGLALAYSLSITSLLSGSVQTFTQTEMDMISVERIAHYVDTIEEEERKDDEAHSVDPAWPREGIIEFRHVSVVYTRSAASSESQNLQRALDDVSVRIPHGQHVGIVGRTGSGKSTLFKALFGLVPLESGRILIDGLSVEERIPLKALRSRLFIIPQEPFLFSGTVRENLDPRGEHSDSELWSALIACSLEGLVRSMSGGLNAPLADRGSDLSVGQRQLMSLTRALLRRPRVLCLDEATASLDPTSEDLMATILERCFRSGDSGSGGGGGGSETTVITIAHKIASVMRCDRVLVMDGGRVIQDGPPAQLARDPDGPFGRLCSSAQSSQ